MIENGPSEDSKAQVPGARDASEPSTVGNDTGETPSAPLDRKARRARRREARKAARTPARTAVKVTASVVVVLAFLALGDRWAVLYAENMAAKQVQDGLKLQAEPEVHIDSFPFLGQVVMGNIDHVEVNVPHVPAGPVSVAQVKGSVDDIRIVGSLPSSVKGAVLSKVRGDVFLAFDDLNREVGASQVKLAPGPRPNTVQAKGDIPVAGKQAQIRGRAHLERTGDHGLALTVSDTRIVVPDLLTYTPGKGGGLQLTAPAIAKMDKQETEQATGERLRPGQLLKGATIDALADHPSLLKPAGIDPSLIKGLQKVQEPKVAQAMEFKAQLPRDLPGDLRLRQVTVSDDGIRARLTGREVPLGT
ncbi:LmeA family phospholipid-binding protein [Streptomyces sp. SDT5-1]|uniref:LmeA family phospholipid-binding protein n=1 Tax=Streptomyces sp. SDT5-1 TaxID=3406418 RepID=UPI003FD538B8